MTPKSAIARPSGTQLEKGHTMPTNRTEAQETLEPDVATTASEPDPTELKVADPSDDAGAMDAPAGVKSTSAQRSVSVSMRGLVVGAVIVALVAAVAVLGWLYVGARHQLDAQATQSTNDAHAEKIALDYAVNAATMDFKDLQAWHVKLVAGTSPDLTKKLSDAGASMEQVLVPLQWSSTAQPLVAKVRSSTGGTYVVDSFVSVQTKTVQAPEALQSTATYSTTIDSNNNWRITDVGGIGSAMGPK
jgi:Mce-associated membrane protein